MSSVASSPIIMSAHRLANRLNQKAVDIEPVREGQSGKENGPDDSGKGGQQMIRPSFRRYIVLFLFCLNAGNKSFQWAQIPASTEKLSFFYGVDTYIINSVAVVFMLAFVVISAPACYAIERIGLRWAVLIGSFGTAVGAVIKLFGYTEDGIYLLFLGQILVSLSEQFIFSVPSRLASVWFPDNQVSSALSISVFGQQIGVALGFLLSQRVMNGAETKEQIELGLYRLFLGTAILSIFAFLADVWLFDEAPKEAPGAARLRQIQEEKASRIANPRQSFLHEMLLLWNQICNLMADKNICRLVFSYGINLGVMYTIQTVLNQMLELVRPGDDILVGNTGFIIITVGTLSLPIVGSFMDKLHRYKMINVMLTLLTILSLTFFTYATVVLQSAWSIYLAGALVGFFQTALVATGLEFAVELTYPAPELVTSSLMNVMPNMIGVMMVYVSTYLGGNFGLIHLNVFYIACVVVALVLLLCTSETLKRQMAVVEKTIGDIDADLRARSFN